MKNYDSHIYLYAKNWYEINNPLEDLKILYSQRNGCYISITDILSCLTDLALNYVKTTREMREFLDDISPENCWRVWRFEDVKYDYWKAVISKCLSILSLTKVSEIENGLDEPDYTLLPKSKN